MKYGQWQQGSHKHATEVGWFCGKRFYISNGFFLYLNNGNARGSQFPLGR
jgi:hypothetical protein